MRDTNSGLNTGSVVQIVFIVLKLLNLIDWSWWVVFIPTWIGLIIVAVLLIAFKLSERKEE